MLNKRIKSVLIAGILVLGMGFAKVDSYAAEITNNITEFNFVNVDDGPLASVHTFEDENITITIRSVGGYTGNPEGTYEISANWDTSMIDMKSINVVTMQNTIEASKETTELELKDGQAFLSIRINIEQAIDAINLEYELADSSSGEEEKEQESVSYVESIIKKYKESMESLGKVSDDGSFRHIDKSHGISKDEWDKFVKNFNDKTDKDNGMRIEYDETNKVYIVYENVNNSIVERIQIDFVDTLDKGWIPGITPGTGQALAVGGIVIGAAAAVGLLVNNRKRKDEE